MKTIVDILNMSVDILKETTISHCGDKRCWDCSRDYCYFDSIVEAIHMMMDDKY